MRSNAIKEMMAAAARIAKRRSDRRAARRQRPGGPAVGGVEEAAGRRAGDRDERQRQGSDRQQVISESYRWHVRQKTVIRPPRRMAASGLPHLKQGSPPRP